MDFLFCSIIYLKKRGGYMGKTDIIKAQEIVSNSKFLILLIMRIHLFIELLMNRLTSIKIF